MEESERRAARILQEVGIIDPDLLKKAEQEKKKSGKRFTEILVALGVNDADVRQALAQRLKLPEIPLQGRKIEQDVLGLIPDTWVHKHGIIPLERILNTLILGMVNPFEIEALKDIKFKTGLNVRPAVVSETELLSTIGAYYATQPQSQEFDVDQVLDEIEDPEVEVLVQGQQDDEVEEEFPEGLEQEGPIIRLVDRVIQDAVKARATDIHVEPARGNVHIRYRIDGVLTDILDVPKYVQGPVLSRIKVMGSMDISDKRRPQDGRSKIKVANRIVDLRISSLPTMYGEKIVIRLLEQKKGIISLTDIGFASHIFDALNHLLAYPQGMILVTGPTGSGKTTTLYSALSRLNDGTTNIVTVEDPIEYQVPGVNQVQINVKAGMTFASGLRSILRQDPDVVLIGEMRDHETAEMAFQAAQTGHLVLSTLHTNDSASCVTRLLSMGMDPYLIASSVLGIMSQRLVRQLCPKCKEPTSIPEHLLPYIPRDVKQESLELFGAKGCRRCRDTGFYGRLPIAEILVPNDTIRDFVLKGRSDREILNVARKSGMKPIFEDGVSRVLEGVTTFEELTRVVAPPQQPPTDGRKKTPITVLEKRNAGNAK